MARKKTVKLSESELKALEDLRDTKFSTDTPLGEVIGATANDEVLAENKEILLTGEGTCRQFGYQNNRLKTSYCNVTSKPLGKDGRQIRGMEPDLIILVNEVSDEMMEQVIHPMRADQIIRL